MEANPTSESNTTHGCETTFLCTPDIGRFQTKSADIRATTCKLADINIHFGVPRVLLVLCLKGGHRGISNEINGCLGTFLCTCGSAGFAFLPAK